MRVKKVDFSTPFYAGQMLLIKMLSFSRLLYSLQTLSLLLRHSDIAKLNAAFTKFIWNGRHPRIDLTRLILSKDR